MLIGIISDTHDNVSSLAKAIEYFNRRPGNLVLQWGVFISIQDKTDLSDWK